MSDLVFKIGKKEYSRDIMNDVLCSMFSSASSTEFGTASYCDATIAEDGSGIEMKGADAPEDGSCPNFFNDTFSCI